MMGLLTDITSGVGSFFGGLLGLNGNDERAKAEAAAQALEDENKRLEDENNALEAYIDELEDKVDNNPLNNPVVLVGGLAVLFVAVFLMKG